jgi:hypothetical protein
MKVANNLMARKKEPIRIHGAAIVTKQSSQRSIPR